MIDYYFIFRIDGEQDKDNKLCEEASQKLQNSEKKLLNLETELKTSKEYNLKLNKVCEESSLKLQNSERKLLSLEAE